MLNRIDRILMATNSPQETAAHWSSHLGAQFNETVDYAPLNARAHRYRLGTGFVEFLEPLGTGPVQSALEARGGAHLFAGGASTPDMAGLTAHLTRQGTEFETMGDQLFIDLSHPKSDKSIAGLRMVVSPFEPRESVGAIDFLYEVTLLHADADEATKRFCDTFGLEAAHFSPIRSEKFGYYGTLTLFDPDDLHRFEVITPLAADNTMGRFFDRTGACLYMAFGESAHMPRIESLVNEAEKPQTIDRPAGRADTKTADQMWLHPPTLGGMMLGISRPSMAWSWSGHPERVKDI